MSVQAIKAGRYSIFRDGEFPKEMPSVTQEITVGSTTDEQDDQLNEMTESLLNEDSANSERDKSGPIKTGSDDDESSQEGLPAFSRTIPDDASNTVDEELKAYFQSSPEHVVLSDGETEKRSAMQNDRTSSSSIRFSDQWSRSDTNRVERREPSEEKLDSTPDLDKDDSDGQPQLSPIQIPPSLAGNYIFGRCSPIQMPPSLSRNESLGQFPHMQTPPSFAGKDNFGFFSPIQTPPSFADNEFSGHSTGLETRDSPWALVPVGNVFTPKQHGGVNLIEESDSQTSSTDSSIHDERCQNILTIHPTVSVPDAVWNHLNIDRGSFSPMLRAMREKVSDISGCLPLLPRPDPFIHAQIAILYNDRDDVIQKLLKADIDHFPDLASIPKEELHRQQMMHLETCFQKICTFGPLRSISDDEYDALYDKTGIDVDNRRRLAAGFFKYTGDLIRRLVQFAHSIPGFSFLPASEQVELIKCCQESIRLMINHNRFNVDVCVGINLDGSWVCHHDVCPPIAHHLRLVTRVCDKFQKLNLCQEEMAIIKAMVVVKSDQEIQYTPPVAEIIYNELYHLLVYVCVRHQHPPDVVVQCLDIIEEFSKISKHSIRVMRSGNVYKYSGLMKNPFYSAVLSKIVPKGAKDLDTLHNSMKDEDVLQTLGVSVYRSDIF